MVLTFSSKQTDSDAYIFLAFLSLISGVVGADIHLRVTQGGYTTSTLKKSTLRMRICWVGDFRPRTWHRHRQRPCYGLWIQACLFAISHCPDTTYHSPWYWQLFARFSRHHNGGKRSVLPLLVFSTLFLLLMRLVLGRLSMRSTLVWRMKGSQVHT
jgi:hypothetical protein